LNIVQSKRHLLFKDDDAVAQTLLASADLLFPAFFKACDNSKRKASQQLFCNLQTGTNLDKKKSALIKILNWQ